MRPVTRSRAKAAGSPPSEAAAAGGSPPQCTPGPSPSTSLSLGIGPAPTSPDDAAGSSRDLNKKPAAAAPLRHNLRLAGAALRLGLGPASPDADAGAGSPSLSLSAPAAAPLRRSRRLAGAAAGNSSSGSGSPGSGSGAGEKMAGRPRARPSASPLATTVSPTTGTSSGDGGGGSGAAGTALPSGDGSGGSNPLTTPRSLPQIGKRRMEAGVGSPHQGQVHDEMPRRDAGTLAKRCKTVLVGGVETVYVSDTESDSDEEDCKMLGPDEIKPSPFAVKMDMTEKGGVDGPANANNGESLQAHNWLQSTIVIEKFVLGPATNGGVVDRIAPSGSASSFEAKVSSDVYFKEEDWSQYSFRKEVKVEEKLVLGNNSSRAGANVGSAVGASSSKLNPDSKGKGKMVVEDSLSSLSLSEDEPGFGPVDSKEAQLDPVDSKETQLNPGSVSAPMEADRRQTVRERAIRLAPKFAFFKADKKYEHSEEEDDEEEEPEPGPDAQDWPGPFATAAGLYEQREAKLRARELNSSKVHKPAKRVILWSPSKDKDRKTPARVQAAPSLTSLCLNTLAEHSECIESLGGIPEELKQKLLKILCHSRKMNTHLLHELLCDSPTELHLIECSWLSEDDFEKTFVKCSTENLQDLQLDISGRCMPDYILPTTLAKFPNCMPLLRKISLKGNYRLSDNGLATIISAAPSLSSLNLRECSLLTSSGIDILANKLHSILRELYIDDCTNVDAMAILPALQKINRLEVLSMCGIQSVCDKFVKELIPVHGSNLKELAFAGCSELTSSSIKIIGQYCQELTSLDIRNLDRLRDSAMRHLRGCKLIRKLKLQRNAFSDEAVSQYLEESGGCLTELMLNNVKKVGDLTALAISRKCSVQLEALDLSFCRELTDEALGLIVDSSPSLRILKLFGCTQVTDLFLKGHSNTSVKIVGIEGSILVQMDNR